MKKPRIYQKEAQEAVFASGRRENLVVMASGLGKTVFAAQVAKQWWFQNMDKRILFLINQVDGLAQGFKEFAETFQYLPVSLGILTGDFKFQLNADMLFATFQSVAGQIRYQLIHQNDFGMVIIDEAHHGQALTYRETIRFFDTELLLGMTATPKRMDGLDIRELFGDEVYCYDLAQALSERAWLTGVEYRLKHDNLAIGAIHDLVQDAITGRYSVSKQEIDQFLFLPECLDVVAREVHVEQAIGNKKTIIFCRTIEHVQEVGGYFPDAEPYHSQMSQREQERVLAEFRNGDLRAILVVNKLNESVDVPDAGLLVFLRTTFSETIWRQQLGRGLRRAPGKTKVVVMDYVGNCERLLMMQRLLDEFQERQESLGVVQKGKQERIKRIEGFEVNFAEELLDVLEVLGRLDEYKRQPFYETWEEASKATQELKIDTSTEYLYRYREDPRLPSNPQATYRSVWKKNGRWAVFLGKPRRVPSRLYQTYDEASAAARRLGIRSSGYWYLREKDPRLPSNPQATYRDEWRKRGGWPGFLWNHNCPYEDPYRTVQEAMTAVARLGISSKDEYFDRFREDSHLTLNPPVVYEHQWERIGGWDGFLGKQQAVDDGDAEILPFPVSG